MDTQPYVLGLTGFVDAGKSTCLAEFTGAKVDKHDAQKAKKITIHLNAGGLNFCEQGRSVMIQIIDTPGHQSLKATMVSALGDMDSVLVVIDLFDLKIEHFLRTLKLLKRIGHDSVGVITTKLDLVPLDQIKKRYIELYGLLQKNFQIFTIIPFVRGHKVHTKLFHKHLAKLCGRPRVDRSVIMSVLRSYNVNNHGTPVEQLKSGVLGGRVYKDCTQEVRFFNLNYGTLPLVLNSRGRGIVTLESGLSFTMAVDNGLGAGVIHNRHQYGQTICVKRLKLTGEVCAVLGPLCLKATAFDTKIVLKQKIPVALNTYPLMLLTRSHQGYLAVTYAYRPEEYTLS